MPNWIEGTIKFRGTRQQLKHMLKNGFESMKTIENNRRNLLRTLTDKVEGVEEKPESDIKVIERDDYLIIESDRGLIFKGMRRAFTDDTSVEAELYEEYETEDDTQTRHIFMFENLRAAWGLDPNELLAFCKEFEVDAYFHGFERGNEFEQVIEVLDGEITKSQERQYENYRWECPFPGLGG